MPRRFFYNSYHDKPLSDYQLGNTISLTEEIHHHWCRVLRAKVGGRANLFDGLGGEYGVELVDINKKTSAVKLLSFMAGDNTPSMTTEIGLVISRGDRMDYAIQKATEMGVTAIQLLTSHHGEVRLKPSQVNKKLNHWQQVAISACEQCGMNRVPLIIAPVAIGEWLVSTKQHPSSNNIPQQTVTQHTTPQPNIACHQVLSDLVNHLSNDDYYQALSQTADMALVLTVPKEHHTHTAQQLQTLLVRSNAPFIRLLIGAEGGLSDDEIQQAQSLGFCPWQIGQRVLRTETAPVAALATLQAWA